MERAVGQSLGDFVIGIDAFETGLVECEVSFANIEIIFVGGSGAVFFGDGKDWGSGGSWWVEGWIWGRCGDYQRRSSNSRR